MNEGIEGIKTREEGDREGVYVSGECPEIDASCICIRNHEIYTQVCLGNYETYPIYALNSGVMR